MEIGITKKYKRELLMTLPILGLAAGLMAGSISGSAQYSRQMEQLARQTAAEKAANSFFANQSEDEICVRAGVSLTYNDQIRDLDVENWKQETVVVTEGQTIEAQQNNVFSFLQGPRSWSEQIPWSGEWALMSVGGNTFGSYGCGLCCMANVYDTLSPYAISPVDMQQYAMTYSNYYPTSESGAISWEDMKITLSQVGIKSKLMRKTGTYEEFQQQMQKAQSMIALVSSNESSEFWQNTPGHYVNIYLYNEADDTVFLAEPGSPTNNRTRIPLRYIYNALKQVSQYQYLLVKSYSEDDNTWKGNGIDDVWVSP